MDHQSDSRSGVLGSQISSSSSIAVNQERDFPSISGQGLNKQQQQHWASYSASDVNTTGSSLKSQPLDSQTRQLILHQSIGSTPVGELKQAMNMTSGARFERQNSINGPTRLQGGSLSHISINPVHCQVSTSKELKSSPLSPVTYIKQKYVDHGAQLLYNSHLSTPQGPSIAQVVQGNVIPATSKDEPLEKLLINSGFTTTNNMMPVNSVSPSLSSQLNRNALLMLMQEHLKESLLLARRNNLKLSVHHHLCQVKSKRYPGPFLTRALNNLMMSLLLAESIFRKRWSDSFLARRTVKFLKQLEGLCMKKKTKKEGFC